jgi:hypothetical protein
LRKGEGFAVLLRAILRTIFGMIATFNATRYALTADFQ